MKMDSNSLQEQVLLNAKTSLEETIYNIIGEKYTINIDINN